MDFTLAGDRDLDEFIFLEYDNVATFDEYEIKDISIDNNNLTNFTTTEIRPTQSGQTPYVTIVDVLGNDTTNPLTFLDNEFVMESYFYVIFPPNANGTITELEVSPLNPILYTLDYGMPKNGSFQLNENGEPQSSIDFSYPNMEDMGECDNELIGYPAEGGAGTVVAY